MRTYFRHLPEVIAGGFTVSYAVKELLQKDLLAAFLVGSCGLWVLAPSLIRLFANDAQKKS